MPGVTKEQKLFAKQFDLLTYLERCDPYELVKEDGGEYSTRSHDSLKISRGLWCWYSRITVGADGKVKHPGGRSALDYLIKVRGMDFISAVRQICKDMGYMERSNLSSSIKPARSPQQQMKTKDKPANGVTLPPRNVNNDKAVAYLLRRKICSDVIHYCLSHGLLYEDAVHHNAVFVGRDENGVPRYACERGTWPDKRFIHEIDGSDKYIGLSIPAKAANNELVVFEAIVDMLSHATLDALTGRDWRAVHRVSLNCLSPRAMLRYLDIHPEVDRVRLCLDADDAGRQATVKMTELLEARGIRVIADPPPINYLKAKLASHSTANDAKDYNDYLKLWLLLNKQQERLTPGEQALCR